MTAENSELFVLPFPVTDALLDDRWKLMGPWSTVYFSQALEAEIHLWVFSSTGPINPTPYFIVGFGTGKGVGPVVRAYAAKDSEVCKKTVADEVRKLCGIKSGTKFYMDRSRSITWANFIAEFLTDELCHEPEFTLEPEKERTVESMLAHVKHLGNLFYRDPVHSVAFLSGYRETSELHEAALKSITMIGNYCRNQEVEAIYWSDELWQEAIKGMPLFEGMNLPDHYIPSTPQLWYFEKPMLIGLDRLRAETTWFTPEWKVANLALWPQLHEGRMHCVQTLILEKEFSSRRQFNDSVPRIILMTSGVAGAPCGHNFAAVMAGIEFMNKAVPREPGQYPGHERRRAEKEGYKLQPYSVMQLRKFEF